MGTKNKIAYLVLIISMFIIIIGCVTKKKALKYDSNAVVETVIDSVSEVNVKKVSKKEGSILKSKNIKIEYKGVSNQDTLTITQTDDKLTITGKGYIVIDNTEILQNVKSNASSSESDSKVSKDFKSVLKEEIEYKEEVIKDNNSFNIYVLFIILVIILIVILFRKLKNKFNLKF